MIAISYADKWNIKLFPAEKDTSSNTMAKLFQSEMTKMMVKGQPSFDKEEAEDLRYSLTARKLSLLPKGSNYIILDMFNLNILFKHRKIVFQSLMTKTTKITMMKKVEEIEEFVQYMNGVQYKTII